MTTAYTSLLGLALPVDGELTGTWGQVVNNSITSLLDTAVAGAATTSVASADWTLSTTSGAANEARAAILRPTGSPGVLRNIIAPSQSKAYIVQNQSNAAVVVKGSATTGVSIAAGKTALVAWNGSDFIEITPSTISSTLPVATGGTGATTLTGVLKGNGTSAFTAATSGTDYSAGTSALATGILKSTTTTGALTIAVAADFPTLNQNTTGTAANLTSATTLPSGMTLVAPILGTPASGTLTNCTGYTYANLSGTVPTWNQNTTGTAAGLSTTLSIASGGTNSTATPTAGGAGYGTGTAHAYTAAGTAGQVLTSQGAAAPTWTTLTSSGGTVTSVSGTGTVSGLTLSGTVTSSGSLTLGGSITGFLPTAGGTMTGAITFSAGQFGTNVNTFLTTPSSANLAAALTDETGSGAAVFATSPTLVTPVLGTPSSGTLSSCTVDGTDAVGFRNIPINSQSTAYTAVLADSGKCIFHPSTDANARTFTIPANSSVAYPIGTAISFVNMTSQVVSIAITTDTMYLAGTGTTGTRSLAQYGTATALKMTSTTWIISGAGVT
jgi:hypothetical protein